MYRLEALEVWKASRRVARSAYGLTMRSPLDRHFRLADQIRGAACSVPANLAEGYGLGTRPQMVRCARIALASAYELRTHIDIAADMQLTCPALLPDVRADCDQAIRLLIGLLRGLERQGET